MHLNVVNFAQTVDHLRSETMAGFQLLTPSVYRQAERTPGHIASARPLDDREDLSFFDRAWGRWGTFTVPSYYVGGRTSDTVYEASALSVWEDISALYSFVYTSLHLRAIQQKHRWFEKMKYPNYAMWWSDAWPTWAEGADRLESLHRNSESPEAFTFKKIYDQTGNRRMLKEIVSVKKEYQEP